MSFSLTKVFTFGIFLFPFISLSQAFSYSPKTVQNSIDSSNHTFSKINRVNKSLTFSYHEIAQTYGFSKITEKHHFALATSLVNNILKQKASFTFKEKISNTQHLYVFEQQYDGMEVESSQAKVIFDDEQKIISLKHNFQKIEKLLHGNISLLQAIENVINANQIPLSQEYAHTIHKLAKKKIIIFGDTPTVVWEISYPVNFLLSNYYYQVETVSGKIIRKDNRIYFENQAQVFQPNPISSSDLSNSATVTLSHLLPNQDYLSGDIITAYNCLEFGPNGKTSTITVKIPPEYKDLAPFLGDTLEVPICYETQFASKKDDSKNKNFFYQPIEKDNKSTLAHEHWGDHFAEVHAYYHINYIYDHIRILLDNELWTLREVPMKVTVNFLMPTFAFGANGMFQLGPMDNAAFMPKENADLFSQLGIERNYDNIIIGQGTFSDFAYDATILYHEFTHGVIEKYVVLHNPQLRPDGIYFDAGALNEGFSDYFSASASGVLDIARYTSEQFNQGSGKDMHIMRSVDNDNFCPNYIGGEVHYDGQIWAGALWKIRTTLSEKGISNSEFDSLVLHTITDDILNESIFEEEALAIIENINIEFGKESADLAKNIFIERGVIDCMRVKNIEDDNKGMTFIPSKSMFQNFAFAPPPVQYRFQSKASANTVLLHFTLDKNAGLSASIMTNPGSIFGGSQEIDLLILVKKGAMVTFSYNIQGISGDHDFEVPVKFSSQDDAFDVEIEIEPSCEQEYYFAIANAGAQSFVIADEEIDFELAKNFDDSDCFITEKIDDSDNIKTSTQNETTISDDSDNHEPVITSTKSNSSHSNTDKDKGCGCNQENTSHDNNIVLLLIVIIIGMILLRKKTI